MNGNADIAEGHFMDNKSVDDYVKDIMLCVRGCQKLSGDLAGLHHYKDYSGVERTMVKVNGLLNSLVTNVFKHQDIKIGLNNHKLLDKFDMIREGNDALLERINSDVDEASGLKKNADAELLEPSVLRKVEGPTITPSGRNVVLLASRSVQKPQLFFSQKVDNSHKRPFLPLIEEKPNNKKPIAILLCLDDAGNEYYSHPYEYELLHWNPMPSQLERVMPKLPKPVSDTPIVMVETPEDLATMITELKECKEFGFDLEHHSYRTYQGLTCLMQISTKEIDYIVDPLALRGHLMPLNEVFTDPKITKIAHGSDHDVFWLQRDCGVYIVNLFDTHQAAIVLEYSHRSLAALLNRFCGIEANKVYQRADWRIRPLPEDFINYARQDSHYLLYIYDLMRNELIEKGNNLNNLITAMYSRSMEICMKRYEKPIVGPESHLDIYRRSRKAFNSRQMFALQALYLWRDRVAREQDESPEYVIPKHMLLQISEVLPKEMQGILACCNPIPPLVKSELLTIHTLIREARQQQLTDIKPLDVENQLPLSVNQISEDSKSALINKHDLSECDENPMDLPVLVKPGENLLGDIFSQHRISVTLKDVSRMFGCLKKSLEHMMAGHYELTSQFISPFERYTKYLEMKPFIEGEKKKGGDQDRIKRIMDHFITLTANTEADVEPEQDPRLRAIHQETNNSQQTRSLQQDLSLITRKEDTQEMANSFERQVTHQAIDSFLESARISNTTEKKTTSDPVGQLLTHYRNIAGGTSAELGEHSPSDENNAVVTSKVPKKTVKKKKSAKKGLVLGDEMKKPKNKTTKRKSSEVTTTDGSPVKKPKEEEEKEDSVPTPDLEDGELPEFKSDDENATPSFDYNKADYSIFKKSKRKAFKSRPIREKFRGKKPKNVEGKAGKSSTT